MIQVWLHIIRKMLKNAIPHNFEKSQVLGIAPLNMRSTCQRRFTTVEVVSDRHWL